MAYAQHSELLPWSFTGVVGSKISVWKFSGTDLLSFFWVHELRRMRTSITMAVIVLGMGFLLRTIASRDTG
jgi:hypothetical protein